MNESREEEKGKSQKKEMAISHFQNWLIGLTRLTVCVPIAVIPIRIRERYIVCYTDDGKNKK